MNDEPQAGADEATQNRGRFENLTALALCRIGGGLDSEHEMPGC